jgi:hypothetical protein
LHQVLKEEADHDVKVKAKSWLQFIVRAIEEDLGKSAIKCANNYCDRIMQMWVKNPNCNKRNIRGSKEWLCELCTIAYDRKQFCEFCCQVYLENTTECSDLDGKEWAQCEGNENCNRWSHVDCLAKQCKKNREEVIAEDFKYICQLCDGKLAGKRKNSKSSCHMKRKRI